MDKKLQDKSSKFFKKEGFYVILFVCLCVVAIVAAFGVKNAMVSKERKEEAAQIQKEEKKIAENVKEPAANVNNKSVDNATEVKNNNKQENVANKNKEEKVAQVANTANKKFVNPVDGTLAKGYSTIPEYVEGLNKAVTHFAIHIKADAGSVVKSAQEGVVTKVYVNDEANKELADSDYKNFGNYVEITHPNGVVARYANLESSSVKKDQKVKQGDVIGKVGNSSITYSSEKYGSHLCFAVYKNGEEQDPLKYVSYKAAN